MSLQKSQSLILFEAPQAPLSIQEKQVQHQKHLEYARNLTSTKYFEKLKGIPYLENKILRIFEEGKVASKPAGDIVCEYGSKSNILYFLLEGTLAVYIKKNEQDLYNQLEVFVNLERLKRAGSGKEAVQLEMSDYQSEWEKMQKLFDTDLLKNLPQYQTTLRQTLPSEETAISEKLKSMIHVAGHALGTEVCSMKKVDEINGFNCFGEIGAILDKPRTATIITVVPSTMVLISYKKYQEIFTQDQIYELNFRVLNLSQTFQDKLIGPEIVAHIASHFYSIPSTTVLYREGDKVDGIYLIQHGHVEIFRTQKDYFKSQISIALKGKGSLIGLEDYFQFSEDNIYNNKSKTALSPSEATEMELNSKRGRRYTATCKELELTIYKIDKDKLDYFVEGNSLFKQVFVGMALKQFVEFRDKFIHNVRLKNALNDQHSSIFKTMNKDKITKPRDNSPLIIEEESKLQNNSQEIPEKKKPKSSQKIIFPEIILFEKTKQKDFQQVFEINKKRIQRPKNSKEITYSPNASASQDDYLSHLNVQKKFFQEHKLRSDKDNFDMEDDFQKISRSSKFIDEISKQQQQKSLQFICFQAKKENEKIIFKKQPSIDRDEEEEMQPNGKHRQHADLTTWKSMSCIENKSESKKIREKSKDEKVFLTHGGQEKQVNISRDYDKSLAERENDGQNDTSVVSLPLIITKTHKTHTLSNLLSPFTPLKTSIHGQNPQQNNNNNNHNIYNSFSHVTSLRLLPSPANILQKDFLTPQNQNSIQKKQDESHDQSLKRSFYLNKDKQSKPQHNLSHSVSTVAFDQDMKYFSPKVSPQRGASPSQLISSPASSYAIQSSLYNSSIQNNISQQQQQQDFSPQVKKSQKINQLNSNIHNSSSPISRMAKQKSHISSIDKSNGNQGIHQTPKHQSPKMSILGGVLSSQDQSPVTKKLNAILQNRNDPDWAFVLSGQNNSSHIINNNSMIIPALAGPIYPNPQFPQNKMLFRSPSKGVSLTNNKQLTPIQTAIFSKQSKTAANYISNIFSSKIQLQNQV